MKKLSDYKGEEAIELWADLIDPITAIVTDKEFIEVVKNCSSRIDMAKCILKTHSKEATDILLRIDDTPINGLNIAARLIALLADIGQSDDVKSFFGYAEQAKTE